MKKILPAFVLILSFLTELGSQPVSSPNDLNEINIPEFAEPVLKPNIKKPSSGIIASKVIVPPLELTVSTTTIPDTLSIGAGSYQSVLFQFAGHQSIIDYQFRQQKIPEECLGISSQETFAKITLQQLYRNIFYYLDPEINDTLNNEQRKTTFRQLSAVKYFLDKDNFGQFQVQTNSLNLNNRLFTNNNLSLDYFHYFGETLGAAVGIKKEWLGEDNEFSELTSAGLTLLLNYQERVSGEITFSPYLDGHYSYSGTLTAVPFADQQLQLTYQQNYQYFILTDLYSPQYIYHQPVRPALDESTRTGINWQYFSGDVFTVSAGYESIYQKNGPVYSTPLNNSGSGQNYVEINYQPDLTKNFWTINARGKISVLSLEGNLKWFSGEKIPYQPELTGYSRAAVNLARITCGAKYQYQSSWFYHLSARALPATNLVSVFSQVYLNDLSTLNLEIGNITGEKIYQQANYFTDRPLIFLTYIAKI